MEVRELRYFVAVAEELHFGRAAGRLGMAQPPLSRAIRDLERQLGVTLLVRTTRQVRLTAAGEVLLRDARTALEAVTAASRRVRQAGSPSPRLRVALKADVDGGLLPQILDAYCADDAALPPELVLGGFGEQPQALRDGLADVGLLLCPFDDRGLDSEPLLEEPVYLATGQDGPAETSIQDWRDARWIAGSPDTLCHTMVIRACQACGFTPRVRHHADDFATVLALVAAGQGVSLIPQLGVTGTPPGVSLTPVTARRRTSIACRKGTSRHPAVSAFAAAIREQSRLLGAVDGITSAA